jgi:hypothetical protein
VQPLTATQNCTKSVPAQYVRLLFMLYHFNCHWVRDRVLWKSPIKFLRLVATVYFMARTESCAKIPHPPLETFTIGGAHFGDAPANRLEW